MLAVVVAGSLAISVLLFPAGGRFSDRYPLGPSPVLAASPSPSGASGDTRSPGEGPGLVGQPILAVLGVLIVAVVSVLVTLAYVRATARAARPERRR